MAINFTEVLLFTDLILIIIVVYLLDLLRKIKKNIKPTEGKQPSETAVPLEAKPDLSVVKIKEPEKAELKPEEKQTVAVSAASSESSLKKDELEDRLLEELHAIPSEVKSEIETTEPGTLKLEDEPPGEAPADMELEDAKPGKVRKPRKKRSKSKKAANTEGAAQTVDEETKSAAGKRTGKKKKAAEQAGQMVEAKPAHEIVKEEKPEESKEPQKDSLF